jgi:hypothetical protein
MAYKKFSEFRFVSGVEYNPTNLTIWLTGQTEAATINWRIVPQDTDGTDIENVIASGELDDLIAVLEIGDVLEGLTAVTGNYDLWLDDTNIGVITAVNIASIVDSGMSWINPVFSNFPMPLLDTVAVYNNSLLDDISGLSFTASIQSVIISGNTSLPAVAQDAIIKTVWDNALTFLQKGKTLDLRGNAPGISAQSQAYLTALLDDGSFNWTVNGETTRTAWTITNNAADLQLATVNLTSNIKLGQHLEGAVTHDWGSVVPVYQLITFADTSGITTPNTGALAARLAAVVNGNITFGSTTVQVCGVHFDTDKTLKGFYVNSTVAVSGAIAQGSQGSTFAADAGSYTCTPIVHFYRDLPASVYAGEKAKIEAGTLYDITHVDGTTYQPLVYNDKMSRIYYIGQAVPVDGVAAKTGFVPIGKNNQGETATAFKGNFDCNGYELRDFHVCSNSRSVGVLGFTSGLKTTKIKSVGHTIIKFGYVGTDSQRCGLIGSNESSRTVLDSYSTGSVNATGNINTYVGGIVGQNYTYSQVNNSYSTGSVSGTGNIQTRIGGLVGNNTNYSQVNNSYSTGSVNGTGNSNTYIGGIVGRTEYYSQVKNCFGYGTVIAYDGAAQLAVRGVYSNSSSSIINCYQLGAVSPNLGETSLADTADFRVKGNFAVQTSLYSTPHDPEATHAINAHVNSGGKYYVSIVAITAQILLDNEGSIPVTNTAYWLEDTGFDFVGTWRQMWDYPKLKIHQLQPVVLQQYINGDN